MLILNADDLIDTMNGSSRERALECWRNAFDWLAQGNRERAASSLRDAIEAFYPYNVEEWGSHPNADNDDCWTSGSYRTRAEAEAAFDEAVKNADKSTTHVTLYGPDTRRIVQVRVRASRDDDDDRAWRHEIAMEAGMGIGIDGYNDAMGY